MFYDIFSRLCDERHISCNKAAAEIGLSNATPTAWKKKGVTPKGDTLAKVADYFGVSVDYLLNDGSSEFSVQHLNCGSSSVHIYKSVSPDGFDWNLIGEDELAGTRKVYKDGRVLIVVDEDGSVDAEMLSKIIDAYKTTATTAVSDRDVRAAFFDGIAPNLSDEERNAVWDEARRFMEFRIAEKQKGKK